MLRALALAILVALIGLVAIAAWSLADEKPKILSATDTPAPLPTGTTGPVLPPADGSSEAKANEDWSLDGDLQAGGTLDLEMHVSVPEDSVYFQLQGSTGPDVSLVLRLMIDETWEVSSSEPECVSCCIARGGGTPLMDCTWPITATTGVTETVSASLVPSEPGEYVIRWFAAIPERMDLVAGHRRADVMIGDGQPGTILRMQ